MSAQSSYQPEVVKVIREYFLSAKREQTLMLPPDAEILAVSARCCVPSLYVKVYRDAEPTVEHKVLMVRSETCLGVIAGDYKGTINIPRWVNDKWDFFALLHVFVGKTPTCDYYETKRSPGTRSSSRS